MNQHIGFMTRRELEVLIEQMVAREVKKQLAAIKKPKAVKEELVDVKELCRELKTTRQTVNNWRNSPKTGPLINTCIHRTGGKVRYDIAAIRELMKSHELFFGKGRDYQYKYEATASDEKKKTDRFNSIEWQLTQHKQISEEDRIFYEQECKWRGDKGVRM